jgi:RNA polymerase sigma-70 factor (ECF subfamily)
MDNGASSYRRYLDGDEAAFEQIVKDYFDSLTYFINGYVHDMDAAEDIAIDAFSDLIVHKLRYNFKVSLKTYLFMIGRSRALNYIKHRGKFQMIEIPEDLPMDSTLEDELLSAERKQVIRQALDQLKPDLREAVHLVYFEQLSCQEAGRVMKRTTKQVYNLLYRAKETLRSILAEENIL